MKKLSNVPMTAEISPEEKQQASDAIKAFNESADALQNASNYLNNIKNPFKDNSSPSAEEVYNNRVALYRFRDSMISSFNLFKRKAFDCIVYMQTFSSDTQSIKLIKSFISAIEELQGSVNEFAKMFSDLKATDFTTKSVEKVEEIQNKCKDLIKLIKERVINHIQTDILATTWVDNVGKELQVNLQKKKPLLVELYNNRQNQNRG